MDQDLLFFTDPLVDLTVRFTAVFVVLALRRVDLTVPDPSGILFTVITLVVPSARFLAAMVLLLPSDRLTIATFLVVPFGCLKTDFDTRVPLADLTRVTLAS